MAGALIASWVFLFGLVIGSFLNVCIYRLPRDLSIVRPRSSCPNCKNPVAWYDNVPVLSYLWLGRKCRHCKAPISWRYAAGELLAASLFLIFYFRFQGNWGWMLIGWFLSAALIVCTFIDFDYFIIPDEISLPGIALGLLVHVVFPALTGHSGHVAALVWSALGAVAGGGLLWLVAVIGRRLYGKDVMGMGDVKLMAMIGAFLGWKLVLLAIFMGSLAGSIVGICLVLSKKSGWQSRIPFGPYLSVGSLLALLVGDPLVRWYWTLFHVS